MTINEYIAQYDNPTLWFVEEVKQPYHLKRISNAIANRDYLAGNHKVKLREDTKYKGKQFIVRKTILNYAKTVLRFHDTYLLGKPVQLSGHEEMVKRFTDITKKGEYETTDYMILDRVNKFGDAYEVVFVDEDVIKSKVLDNCDCYPVYSDKGEYLSFIEHWTDAYTNISYYNVYYQGYVENWSNAGGEIHLVETKINVSGLPIHYHNFSDTDYNFGESLLTDMIPIMDELEDILSKFGDAIYTNSLNPMPVAIGQRIESTIPADAMGYVMNLDSGDYKVVSTTMDYNSVRLYLNELKQFLSDISCVPTIFNAGTEISNISETSMRLLMHMANVLSDENKKWLNRGFKQRFAIIAHILKMQGVNLCDDNCLEVVYNISMPVATTEMINNLKALRDLGAISIETIMEKSDIVSDVESEKVRLSGENTTL